ncbi:NAD(P)-dependent oxidoreductase [Kitasatospora sp. NBC_01287]|uniref:NAD(P)-dependent oxidoreductase n=1 Tax=Kitasatospora sp. NBC_01287 TaxID=2903573 RepID=UPI002258EB6F|nr:NAD(P)-dependent oxidoreductase [Kitasatospora sp. NBC_01287]MCX4744475.1 NAD(P)-dependent oxidoreductase [Kitasatospora sp. NBC_01287]
MADVAVVGLGIMGRGMVENLLKHGHRVVVWNRSPERARALAEAGAEPAATPARAVERAEVVFEVTADDSSSRQVWLGPDGILAGARAEAVLITSATLSVGWVEELAAACAELGRTFLDMPLTGGSAGAASGNLVLLTGGDAAAVELIAPVLEAISREVKHFGPVGAGTRFKLVLNTLQAIHLAGFGEALRLATAAGLDPRQVGPALIDRPGGAITQQAWNSLVTPPEPINFSAEWAAKDLDYAALLADRIDLPVLASVRALFAAALADGRGGQDWSTINTSANTSA